MNYQISLPQVVFDKIILSTKPDAKAKDVFNFIGVDWLKPIQSAVSETENEDIALTVDNSRLYVNPKRSTTNFLSINAQCSYCRSTQRNSYKFTVSERPVEANQLVIINVQNSGKHEHHGKKQIRGDKRVAMAHDVQINSNGSSLNYVNKCEGAGVQGVPNVGTVRKIVSDVMNQEMVSTCWISNLLHSADCCKSLLRGRVIDGYVQRTELGNKI